MADPQQEDFEQYKVTPGAASTPTAAPDDEFSQYRVTSLRDEQSKPAGVLRTAWNDITGSFRDKPGESIEQRVAGGALGTKGAEAEAEQKEQDVKAGNVRGVYGHLLADELPAVIGAAHALTPSDAFSGIKSPLRWLSEPASTDLGAKAKAVAKLGVADAASHIPVAGRAFRRPSVFDYFKAARDAKAPENPTFYNQPAGPRWPSGNFEPAEGEYIDTPPVRPSGPPVADAVELNMPPASRPAPYRYGPGSIADDFIAKPPADNVFERMNENPRVLARNQGIRTTPRGLLNAPLENYEGPPPAKPPSASYQDNFEDAVVRDRMQDDLDREGRHVYGEQRREFADRNSMDKPKWLRQVEAENQQRLEAAAAKAQRPTKLTETPPAKTADFVKARTSDQPSVTSPNDLETTLRKSVEQAQTKKQAATEPIRVDFDESGNIVDGDGRHRVIEALQRGDKTIAVQTKLADGSVQTLHVSPEAAAKRLGVTPESLKATDAQQSAFKLKVRRR